MRIPRAGTGSRAVARGLASVLGGRRGATRAAIALLLGAFALSGCGVVGAVRKAAHAVQGNRATIDTFTNKMQTGGATTFEATYLTTGGSPATIVYGVAPPRGLVFKDTPSGTSTNSVDIVVNTSGEYSCSAKPSGSSCEKLGTADAAAQNKIFDFYTPSHWIAFLKDFSLAAGIAGDTVSSSTMTVNGFAMQCVDFRAPGVAGTSTICTTAQGILGYVRVASSPTSFEITNYTASPPASLFALPPGATITTIPTGTIPTGTIPTGTIPAS